MTSEFRDFSLRSEWGKHKSMRFILQRYKQRLMQIRIDAVEMDKKSSGEKWKETVNSFCLFSIFLLSVFFFYSFDVVSSTSFFFFCKNWWIRLYVICWSRNDWINYSNKFNSFSNKFLKVLFLSELMRLFRRKKLW